MKSATDKLIRRALWKSGSGLFFSADFHSTDEVDIMQFRKPYSGATVVSQTVRFRPFPTVKVDITIHRLVHSWSDGQHKLYQKVSLSAHFSLHCTGLWRRRRLEDRCRDAEKTASVLKTRVSHRSLWETFKLQNYRQEGEIKEEIYIYIYIYIYTQVKVKQSRYTPWRRLGGEEL
jgi:hypothetical protein